MLDFPPLRVLTPMLAVVPAVKPSDFLAVPYSSASLLEMALPIAVVVHSSFGQACEEGYYGYFRGMMRGSGLFDACFENHFYTWDEVAAFLADELVSMPLDTVAWRAGFLLGWLSALALTDRALALRGVEVLRMLMACELCAMSVASVV